MVEREREEEKGEEVEEAITNLLPFFPLEICGVTSSQLTLGGRKAGTAGWGRE